MNRRSGSRAGARRRRAAEDARRLALVDPSARARHTAAAEREAVAAEAFAVIGDAVGEMTGTAAAARESSLARYGRDEAADGWRFLTGDEPSIRRLTEAVGFRFSYDPARGQYAHAAGLFVLTPDGKVSHYLNGVQFSARDLRLSLVEASDHEVGTAADYRPAVARPQAP